MNLVEGSLLFTEMEIDENGNATPTGNVGLPEGAQISLIENGFEITGITTDKPYKITYQTKIEGRIVDTINVSNTAGFGPHEVEGVGPGTLGKYYGSKSAGKIDYAAKTVDWKIELNLDEYPMHNIVIEDTLGPGLTLIEDSFAIKIDGDEYTGDFSVVVSSENQSMFTLSFPNDFSTEKLVEITYKTNFNANAVTNYEPTNEAVIKWTPSENGPELSGEVSAKTEFNLETIDMNWKNGSYDPATKKITWEVFVNYRENQFENLRIEDTLQGNQQLVENSFVVKELNIDSDGKYTEGTVIQPTINQSSTDIEIEIGETNKAYKITYETSLEDLEEINQTYVNEAYIFDGENSIHEEPLVAEVGIYKEQKYADKSGMQEDNSKIADWSILVNIAQEKITGLKLTDTASSNQEYIEDSIKVYEVVYENGEPQKGSPLDESDYTVTVQKATTIEDSPSFVIEWDETVERAFIIEYSTLFFAGHNEKIENTYKIEGNLKELSNEDSNNGSSITIRQTASGSASGKSGRLIVKKLDTTYDFGTRDAKNTDLEGIAFDLVDVSSDRVVKSGETDSNGELDFGRLLFGTYKLVEKNVPDGYIAPNQDKIITINKEYSDIVADHTVEIENYEAIYAVELTKVDSVNASTKLQGAEFAIYHSEQDANSDSNRIATGTTNNEGYIVFNLKDSNVTEAKTYYVKEINPPEFYQQNNNVYSVNIGSAERKPVNLGNITNELYPGQGQLRKIDAELDNANQIVGLSEAKFEVYDINEKVVDTFTTGEGGVGTTKPLPPGIYTVKEVSAPIGFEKSEGTFYLEIPKANLTETYNITTEQSGTERVDVANTVKRTNLELTKVDSENSNQKIEGVTFRITQYDGSDYNGRYDEIANLLVDSDATTDSNGIATFTNLPPGKYTIEEVGTPADYGYIPNSVGQEIWVTYSDVNVETTPKKQVITNKPLAKVTLEKLDSETNYPLAGAKFELYKKAENDEYVKVTHYNIETFITDSNGKFVITGLTPGDYELRETEAPIGYEMGTQTTRSFTVPEVDMLSSAGNTELIEFTIEGNEEHVTNDIIKGSFTLTKEDGDTQQILEGVEFKLTATSLVNVTNDTFITSYNDRTDFIQSTNSDGEVTFENLRPGTYLLEEITPLAGYQEHWEEIKFNIPFQNAEQNLDLEIERDIVNYKKRELTVTKIWDDLDASLRPEIEIELVRKTGNGSFESLSPKVTHSLTSPDLEYTFEDLDAVDANGNLYTYSVVELKVDGYVSVVGDTNEVDSEKHKQSVVLTNTAKTTNIELTKTDSISGALIDGAEFTLTYPDGTTTETGTTQNGKLTFEDLQPGMYTLNETKAAPGYILNTEEKTIQISLEDVEKGTIKEVEFNNKPLAEVIILKQDLDTETNLAGATFKITGIDFDDETKVIYENTVTTENDEPVSVTGLPAGEYTIEEVTPPSGYSKHGNDNDKRTFTVLPDGTDTVIHDFTHSDRPLNDGSFRNNIITGSVELTKQDNNGVPMQNVNFTLEAVSLDFADENFVDAYNAELQNPYTTDEQGKLKITDLRPGEYTLTEIIPDGYQDDYVENNTEYHIQKGVFEFTIYPAESEEDTATELNLGTITNYELIEISVTKEWKDDGNTDSRILNDQQIHLVRQVSGGTEETVNSVDLEVVDKTYTFTELPVVNDLGQPYVYSVKEDEVPGYATEITNDGDNFIITNTRSEDTSISGTKHWDFGVAGEQYIPDQITVKLLNEAKEVVQTQTVTADSDGNWEYSFNDIPRFDENGIEIEYTVEEEEIIGFVSEVNEFDIYNTQETIEIEVTKNWVEVDSQYRPNSVTIEVKNGDEVVASHVLTDEHEKDEWTYTFTNLPKYDKDGIEITYTVDEKEVPVGYEKSIEENEITNEQILTDIIVTKKWAEGDSSNRPDEITVQLKIGDEVVSEHSLSGDKNAGTWTHTFTNLPMYDAEGNVIEYSVDEVVPPGYKKSIDGYEITNTRAELRDITVTKQWLDDNSPERPDSIQVQLYQNGDSFEEPIEILADEEWTYVFEELEAFDENGIAYEYTIEELPVDGYEPSIDGFEITNLRVGTTEVTGTKTWVEVEESYRPESITVYLLANGEKVDEQVVTEADAWAYAFTELPKYDDEGKEIEYTIDEEPVVGYEKDIIETNITNTQITTEVSGIKTWKDDNSEERPETITVHLLQNGEIIDSQDVTAEDDWAYSFTDLVKFDEEGNEYTYTVEEEPIEGYESTVEGYDITNVRVGTTEVIGTKTWKDDNEADRPASIKVNLLQNGIVIDTKEVTATDDWTYSFTELDKYDEDGVEYEYTIAEHDVPGYQSEVDGFNLTNTRSEERDITVTKAWVNDNETLRPDAITVTLFQNGEVYKTVQITAADEWKYTFENVPSFDEDGVAYEYTIDEALVPSYETTIDGFNITNTHETGVLGNNVVVDGNKENGKGLPSTATNIYNLIAAGLAFILIGTGIIFYRRRKAA